VELREEIVLLGFGRQSGYRHEAAED
jgi:hypothetical protein